MGYYQLRHVLVRNSAALWPQRLECYNIGCYNIKWFRHFCICSRHLAPKSVFIVKTLAIKLLIAYEKDVPLRAAQKLLLLLKLNFAVQLDILRTVNSWKQQMFYKSYCLWLLPVAGCCFAMQHVFRILHASSVVAYIVSRFSSAWLGVAWLFSIWSILSLGGTPEWLKWHNLCSNCLIRAVV